MPKPRRNLNLYSTSNESRFAKKKKRNRGWIIDHIEAAEARMQEQMLELKLDSYLDIAIKSIANCTWVQLQDCYMIQLKVESDLLIDLRTKRLAEIASLIKLHFAANMIIVTADELIIYKNTLPKRSIDKLLIDNR